VHALRRSCGVSTHGNRRLPRSFGLKEQWGRSARRGEAAKKLPKGPLPARTHRSQKFGALIEGAERAYTQCVARSMRTTGTGHAWRGLRPCPCRALQDLRTPQTAFEFGHQLQQDRGAMAIKGGNRRFRVLKTPDSTRRFMQRFRC